MKHYKKAFIQVESKPDWQTRIPTVGRRKLEEGRGKKLICQSCRQEIKEDFMVVAHIHNSKNLMIHEECADPNVEIKRI